MSIITFEGLCTTLEASTNGSYNTGLLLNALFWLYIQGTKMHKQLPTLETLHLTFKAWNLQGLFESSTFVTVSAKTGHVRTW